MTAISNPLNRRGVLAAGVLAALGAGLSACAGKEPQGTGDDAPAAARQDGSADAGTAAVEPDAGSAQKEEPEPEPQSSAERVLASMTLEQKVAQLFCVTPEQLTGTSVATIAGKMTADALARIPVGGLIYFSQNIVGNRQLRDMLAGTDRISRASGAGVPALLAVDEEGGTLVARVARSGLFDVPTFPNMIEIGATGDTARAAEVGEAIGTYLADIGFNLDFAPDADVLTNPDNPVIGPRAFSGDAAVVARMVAAEVEAMRATGVAPCVKHFPGHGDTQGDSHTGAVFTERTREQIESCELEPFRAAIEAGTPFIMVGHIETPNYAADGLPASLSPIMIGEVLRDELGFDGVIISDSFAMGAITQNYAAADAAVRFFQAGGDMLLMPQDLQAAYDGVLAAVGSGSLSAERIDESTLRILTAKEHLGLLA